MVRVEAAWRQGKPVFFDVRGLWKHESTLYASASPVQPGTSSVYPAIVFFAFFSLLAGAALAARYNLRLRRGDRKGASQIAGLTFICTMGYWALTASHVARYWELHLAVKAISTAVFASGLVWSLYLAIEPPVRRNWPDSLISWTRLQRHRLRDPLVASHVLAGTLVISVFMALRVVRLQLAPATMPMGFAFTSLNGIAMFIGNLMASVVPGLVFGMGFLLVVVMVRLRIRRVLRIRQARAHQAAPEGAPLQLASSRSSSSTLTSSFRRSPAEFAKHWNSDAGRGSIPDFSWKRIGGTLGVFSLYSTILP